MGVTVGWNDAVVAESDHTGMVEGNHYFAPEALTREDIRESQLQRV